MNTLLELLSNSRIVNRIRTINVMRVLVILMLITAGVVLSLSG